MYRSDYPRPSFVRDAWENLNGPWAFGVCGPEGCLGQELPETIEVPFCPEAPLSGIGRRGFMPDVWYRRSFTVDPARLAGRVLLRFGAVDYETRVFVNGRPAGTHTGGYAGFAFDVTDLLSPGENVLDVGVHDDVRDPACPSGKQSGREENYGCYYTRSTGIWQTVWLEFVPRNYIKACRIVPDTLTGEVLLEAEAVTGGEFSAELSKDGKTLVRGSCTSAEPRFRLTLPAVPAPELWEPGHPALYDLELHLSGGESERDTVRTYCGFRRFELRHRRFYLNGKPLFLRQVLDQGYYPGGVYTAPTAEALGRDIELGLELGFNGARPHQKAFEDRYLYEADRKGYLVWGEYPNWGCVFDAGNPAGVENLLREWEELVCRDRNHPALIGWCPLNEARRPGHHPCDGASQRRLYALTKALDPDRPVVGASGGDIYVSDLFDFHTYDRDPEVLHRKITRGHVRGRPLTVVNRGKTPEERLMTRRELSRLPMFLSECGGISYRTQGEIWGYRDPAGSEAEFLARYRALTDEIFASGLAGFCYTQLTDVEQEQNGLVFFDRRHKLSPAGVEALRRCNRQEKE